MVYIAWHNYSSQSSIWEWKGGRILLMVFMTHLSHIQVRTSSTGLNEASKGTFHKVEKKIKCTALTKNLLKTLAISLQMLCTLR